MPVSFSPWLVALSITLAIQGSYVGSSLAVQVAQAAGSRRRILLAAAATSLALAVWTMHFVGMLAERSPFPVDYLVLPTLISFLVCVIVVGFALLAASAGPATLARLGSAAAVMGLGIVAMHYIGMQSLAACAEMVNSPSLVLAAVAVAIAASGLALWLAFGRSSQRLPFSATALGLAISGMHYTAVSGLSLYPTGAIPAAHSVMSPDFLAVVVAFVAFVVSGCFLLLLVPDRSGKSASDQAEAPTHPSSWTEPQPETVAEPPSSAAEPVVAAFATFAPQGGVGGPPKKAASHIPVERNGLTSYLPAELIAAVRADAHYTQVFDGERSHFCALSIGEIEHRLDPQRFMRVHRSYIVNIERVEFAKFTGDAGVLELAAREAYSVPVSRSRIRPVKARLSVTRSAAE